MKNKSDMIEIGPLTTMEGVYVTLRSGRVDKSVEADELVTLDYDDKGRLLGVEIARPEE